MTEIPTKNADLIKRLRSRTLTTVTSGHDNVEPDADCQAAADALEAAELLMDREFIDHHGEPVVTSNAAFQEILHLREALEAAERVIAPFCKAVKHISKAHLDGHVTDKDQMFVQVIHLRAAADWLARHATGQRGGRGR